MALPRFIRNMILARQRAALPVELDRRRIFILPTRAGLVFAFFLLAMLVAAVNYTNNLAFLLTFVLGSIAVVSSIHAYANLAGLRIEQARLLPAFCGDEARLQISVRAAGRGRRSIDVGVGTVRDGFSLLPGRGRELDLHVPTTRRGLFSLGQVVVSTHFPLGLFRAWSPLILPVTGLVYPRTLPADGLERFLCRAGEEDGVDVAAPAGEFAGIRPYRPGDAMSRVSWKASARGSGLYAKEFGVGTARTLMLDWIDVPGPGYEERIGRLAWLVREAERRGLCYGLRLPGRDIEAGCGPGQAHLCLEALALLPEEP
jgi:uncharacterized protein (DUF58 family)